MTPPTTGTLSLLLFEITENIVAIASRNRCHTTKMGTRRQVPQTGTETDCLFLETEKLLIFQRAVRSKTSLPRNGIPGMTPQVCNTSLKRFTHRVGHTAIMCPLFAMLYPRTRVITLSLRQPQHQWSSRIARSKSVRCQPPFVTMFSPPILRWAVLPVKLTRSNDLVSINQTAGFTWGVSIGILPEMILSSFAKSMWILFSVSCSHLTCFSRFGEVTDAFIPFDKERNKAKGFAFVTFA